MHMKSTARRLGIFGGAALLALGPIAHAAAEPITMAPQVYDKQSRDGWHLQIRIDNEVVNPVPNLAAAANSREAFVTASVTAAATGGGSPITDSLLILGYQLGCQIDVSTGLNLGGTAGIGGPSIGLNAGNGGPPGVSVGGATGIAGFIQTV